MSSRDWIRPNSEDPILVPLSEWVLRHLCASIERIGARVWSSQKPIFHLARGGSDVVVLGNSSAKLVVWKRIGLELLAWAVSRGRTVMYELSPLIITRARLTRQYTERRGMPPSLADSPRPLLDNAAAFSFPNDNSGSENMSVHTELHKLIRVVPVTKCYSQC
jgi:hypothetical protein